MWAGRGCRTGYPDLLVTKRRLLCPHRRCREGSDLGEQRARAPISFCRISSESGVTKSRIEKLAEMAEISPALTLRAIENPAPPAAAAAAAAAALAPATATATATAAAAAAPHAPAPAAPPAAGGDGDEEEGGGWLGE